MTETPEIDRLASIFLSFWRGDEISVEDESLLVLTDMDGLKAWPIYAAALELASDGAEEIRVGWQQISYYAMYAQRDWAQEVPELAEKIALSAQQSARLGRLLSDRVVLDCAARQPGIGLLTAEVMDAVHDWGWARHIEAVYQTIRDDQSRPLELSPPSDFVSPSLRRLLLRPILPELDAEGSEDPAAWVHWARAVALNDCIESSVEKFEAALSQFCIGSDFFDTFRLDSAIVSVLHRDVISFAADSRARELLANFLRQEARSSQSVWLYAAANVLEAEMMPDPGAPRVSGWRRIREPS